ncbi:hypothetical protein [Microscilla marina]|uniref:Brp/Blh family beta-carotene 15,15'-monooxygenase n=1 Tax=Microscilla marina ATCC 23134 TaxID=313606 RepID=A1ZYK0_MICM2|nr:hypothetical protein [Microscilla marina]EAY24584.1 conserved hypothetical protein [Microscilla marina ATCC 23134]
MKEQQEYVETLTEIRSLMEKSSRFLSLSGLSGIFAGVFALLGAGAAFVYLKAPYADYYTRAINADDSINIDFLTFFIIDALSVLVLSLSAGVYFTWRKAKRKGLKLMPKPAVRLFWNLMIPLATGGLFCVVLGYHGYFALVAPCTLIFYGLALVNGSRYTLNEIRYLGITEIALGLISSFLIGYGLLFWAIGFGVLHIVYGALMWYRHER